MIGTILSWAVVVIGTLWPFRSDNTTQGERMEIQTPVSIDAEFQSLIPPLQPTEYEQLETNIQLDGCLDPIKVWNTTIDGVDRCLVIDGHNRYSICDRLGVHYMTTALVFATRDEAKLWIISNQFGRRNLSAIDRIALAFKREEILAVKAKDSQKRKPISVLPNLVKQNRIHAQVLSALDAGVSKGTYHAGTKVLQAIENGTLARDTIDKIRGGELAINTVYNRLRQDERAEEVRDQLVNVAIPAGKFRVIYADPPWWYATPQHSKTEQATVLKSHYPSMKISELCELPVAQLADENAVLFLWTTSPLLFDALNVIEAWGFTYKASIIWDKVKHNVGHYVSVRHEFLLICTRGSCLPDSDKLHDSVIEIERTAHSEKPAYFRELIDIMYEPVDGDRVELFARSEIPSHWASWGNQHANA